LFAERDLNRVVPQGAHLALRATLTRWVRIAISQAAFDAIAATLALGTVAVEPERDEDGNVHIWLDPGILARLKALRGLGESYRDVILRVAKGEGGDLMTTH
jgi:hypothetical protein